MTEDNLTQLYADFKVNGGCFVLSPRCFLELTGADRAAFLHNFCTADVQALTPGSISELFILDTRGKTLAFGHVIASDEALFITTADHEHSADLMQHLDKYIIREKVSIVDHSANWAAVFVAGPAEAKLELGEIMADNSFRNIEFDFCRAMAMRMELADFGTLLVFDKEHLDLLSQWLNDRGVKCFPSELFHAQRIESGTPAYGCEIDQSNLPQEMRRDEKSISFTKGCYLGQETVAKIDAFGHVNRFLVGLEFTGECEPEVESVLELDGKKTGILKSVTYSPHLKKWLGMGFVKCKHADVGTVVMAAEMEARVIQLPIAAS